MLKQTVDPHVSRRRDMDHGRAQEGVATRALAVLEDPEHGFITSDFLGMEISLKALYHRRAEEVAPEERDIMKVAAKTDLGRVRSINEDRLLVDEPLGLFVVADGMGGRAGGEVASALAVEAIAASVREHLTGLQPTAQTAEMLHTALHAADEAVWTAAKTHRKWRGMGTTVVVALRQGDQLHIAHVGDSRAYLFHHEELHPLTEDHSVVAQLLKSGQITPRQARTHPLRHQITRWLGSGKAAADLVCVPWQGGDTLLLCSDGLTTMVPDRQIKALLRQAGEDAHAACEALVAHANARGGKDNVSVILAQRA
jgi:PPM family protein phosphatase